MKWQADDFDRNFGRLVNVVICGQRKGMDGTEES
jgi:hypothetical protein